LLTAMLGYTFVALSLLVDLGRYYNIWHPMLPSMWQGNSVLFEVAMCVMCYLTVLYIEFIPIAAERFSGRVNMPGVLSILNRPVDWLLTGANKVLAKVMIVFIIAGVVLSFMHQSSLGSLMLIAPAKMHELWYTPILPLLFLLSAIMVGYPMVVVESIASARSFGRKPEMDVVGPLSRIMAVIVGIYAIARIGDVVVRQAWPQVFAGTLESWMFLAEVLLGVLLPLALLTTQKVRTSAPLLFTSGLLVVLGVALNRINVFLVAYKPAGADSRYVPSIVEVLVTVGLIATLILVYRLAVLIFPVLPKEESHTDERHSHTPPPEGI